MKRGSFRSFAKVNLGLEVGDRRPNGYHELKTIFATVDLHDVVEIESASSGIEVDTSDAAVRDDETNLAYRAAAAMQRLAGTTTGVRIRIRKNIPVGGGLGGGSSNAATVLRALDYLWKTGLGTSGLLEAAKGLGADVPYFLYGGTAIGTGRGDEIRSLRLALPPRVLLIPGTHGLSTAAVFAKLAATRKKRRSKSSGIAALLRWIARSPGGANPRLLNGLENELEAPAAALSPEIAEKGKRLRAIGQASEAVQTAMSGSGSTYFMSFDSAASLRTAKLILEAEGVGSIPGRFLARQTFVRQFMAERGETLKR